MLESITIRLTQRKKLVLTMQEAKTVFDDLGMIFEAGRRLEGLDPSVHSIKSGKSCGDYSGPDGHVIAGITDGSEFDVECNVSCMGTPSAGHDK